MLLFFIVLYLCATVVVGWWASRRVKTAADYVVAGKRLPMFMAACALFATWFGSETVMGSSSEFVEHGLIGVIEDPFGAALCLFLAGALIARPLYDMNLLTFSDFFRIRFGRASEFLSAIFMVPSYLGWIAAQLVALAIVFQTVCGLDREVGVILCTILVLTYTYIGGMWSVSITDFVQTIAIVTGLLVLAVDMVWSVGGFKPMFEAAPAGFFRFFPEAKPIPMIQWVAAWMTIGLGSVPQQDVFQRVMAAKTLKTSIWACYTSSLMYLSIAFLPLIICYCGKMLYPDLLTTGDTQMALPNMVLRHCGLPLQILFFGALISAILSTASGAMLAPATVIGENLIKPMFKDMTDQQLLYVMRLSLVGVGVMTAIMALMRNNIYELVGESSAISLVSLFVPLVGGLYYKRGTNIGAMASMLVGAAVWGLATWLTEPDNPDAPLWAQVPPLIYGFVASIMGMVVGSFFSEKK
jgi:solute:Na+ symporter, SSS family